MAVPTTNAFDGPYEANGVATTFPFTFTALSSGDVGVQIDGIDVGGFSVTISPVSGGSVTFDAAPVSGTIYIVLQPAFTQNTKYEDGSAWRAGPQNAALDRAALRDQALQRDILRGIMAPMGDTLGVLPAITGRAGKFLAFDAAGRAFASAGSGVDGGIRTDLAEEAGAALVGFSGASTFADGTIGRALKDVSFAPNTDKFITNLDGAKIHRLGDRALVGGAVVNDGHYPNVGQDWYTAYEVAQGRPNGIIVSTQMAVLTNNYAGAAVAFLAAARTSNLIAGVGGAVGLEAHVVNDNTASSHDAWAMYSEATRDSEGVGAIITYEADARNKGAYHAITPYAQHPKQSVVHQIASGAALSGVGCEDVSAGINFRENPTKFGAGIVFGANAIRGTDGVTGYGNAILAALGHRFTWVNASGDRVGWITATATSAGAATGIEFAQNGMLVLGPSDTTLARFKATSNAVNYLDVTPGATGQSVQVRASGADTNIDLFLQAKGTGAIALSPDAVRNYANDTAAAAGGVAVGGLYHTAGAVKIRIA